MVSPAKEKITLLTSKLLIYPEMNNNGPISEAVVFGIEIYVILTTLLAWGLGVAELLNYGITLLVIGSAASMFYSFTQKRNSDWIIFAGLVISMVATFYFMMRLGGILTSAGLVLVAPVIVIVSVILERADWSRWLMVLYFTMLVLFMIAPDSWSAEPSLTYSENILFFSVNAAFLGLCILILLNNLIASHRKVADSEYKQQNEKMFLLRARTKLYTELNSDINGHLTRVVQTLDHIPAAANGGNGQYNLLKDQTLKLLKTLELKKDLAEVESRTMRIRKVQTDFIKFGRYVTEELSSRTLQKNINIVHETGINQFNLDFDPLQVFRIIGWLVDDSLSRSKSNGTIVIRINREQENSWMDLLLVTVTDTGGSLEESLKKLMFHPDYEGIDEKGRYPQVTAAGLMMAGELIRIMGGKLYVKNRENKGTSFRIILPAHNASRFAGHEEVKTLLAAHLYGSEPINGKASAKEFADIPENISKES